VPDGALLYVSSTNLAAPLKTVLELAGTSVQRLENRRLRGDDLRPRRGGQAVRHEHGQAGRANDLGPVEQSRRRSAYRSARDGANVPSKVAAFAYGDMENGLPYVLRLAAQSGTNVPPQAFANVKPLHGAVVYLVKDGDALRISGFQTIK
jgi:hypothetical protein